MFINTCTNVILTLIASFIFLFDSLRHTLKNDQLTSKGI